MVVSREHSSFGRRVIAGKLALLALLSLVAGLSIWAGATSAAEVVDARARAIETGVGKRIVTLGSDVTEIVYALDAGSRVIAVDRGSKYPPDVTTKANVGYRRELSVEGLVALDPDLILAADDIGPTEVVDVLTSLSVPIVFVPEDNSREGIQRKIETIAAALDLRDEGRQLSSKMIATFDAAAKRTAGLPNDQRRKVVFFHGLIKLTAAGSGTAADAVIRYAGGINPMAVFEGYKPASEEKLIEFAPDVILMMGDGKGGPTPDEVFSIPALSATPAARNRALVVLDGAYMIGFGPRTADAIRDLADALYPAMSVAE